MGWKRINKEDVRVVIKALLLSQKEAIYTGVPIAQLDNDYYNSEGIRIPFRQLGYSSLFNFLRTLTDILTLKYKNGNRVAFLVEDENTKKIQSQSLQLPARVDGKTFTEILTMIKETPDGIWITRIIEYANRRMNCNVDVQDLTRRLSDISHELIIEKDAVYPIGQYSSKRIDFLQPRTNCTESGPAGDTDYDSEDEPIPRTANSTRYGECESQQNIEEPRDNNCLTDETSCRDDRHDFENENGMRNIVHDSVKQRLQNLILKYPDGIWCADLPTLYEEEYEVPLNYEELGIYSVLSFASYLPDIFHCVQPQDKGDYKLYDARVEKPSVKETKIPVKTTFAASYDVYGLNGEIPEPVPVLSKDIANRLIPDDVMKIGETIAQISVIELHQSPNATLEVIIVELFTPSFFWIQLHERMPNFELFMDELHDFYEKEARNYLIPPAIIAKGLNCACKYREQWHRGIITNVTDDRKVTVLFYDYGTLDTYKPDYIHFLYKSFANLPAQAIPCGLYNIKPLGTAKWSKSVTMEFADKVLEVPLFAMIAQIDTENNSMLIGLTDTRDKEDLHINDWLVNKGYAEYGKMVCIRPPNYTFRRFLECDYINSSDKIKRSTLASSSENIPTFPQKNEKPRDSFSSDRNQEMCNILSTCHSSPGSGKNSLKSRITNNSSMPRMRHEDNNFLKVSESRSCKDEENVDTNNRSSCDVKINGIELCENYPSPDRSSRSADFDDNLDVCMNRTYDIVPCNSTSLLCKETSKSTCVTNNNDKSDELPEDLPLHLKTPTSKELDDFGTLRSRYGGFGRMEPIEWANLCKSKKIVEETSQAVASSRLGSITKRRTDEKSLLLIDQSSSLKESIDRDDSDMRIIVENKKNLDEINRMSTNDSPSFPKLPKSKRTLWNLVTNHTDKNNLQIDRISYRDKDENPERLTKKIAQTSDELMETKTISHTNDKIVDVTEKASANMENISEFGHFSSMWGGNSNKEPVTWSELRELIKHSNRSMEAATPTVTSNNAVPRKSRMPLNLPQAHKTWLKIINSNDIMNHEATGRNSLWVPEGNIRMGRDFTSTLRAMTKGLEKESNDHVRIFIPNEILELLKRENITEVSTSPESVLEVSSSLPREAQKLNDENANLDSTRTTEFPLDKISEDCPSEKPLNGTLTAIPKDNNTLVQNVRLKLDSKQLVKLFAARLDSMNDSMSDLDSDDLSFTEETKRVTDTSVEENFPASSSKDSDSEISRKDEDHVATERSRKNIDDTTVQLSERDYPVIDTDSLNPDDYLDEWDFQPGWFNNSTLDIDRDNTEMDGSSRVRYSDESSLEITDNLDANTTITGSSRQESETDTHPIDDKYSNIDETSSNTIKVPLLSSGDDFTLVERDWSNCSERREFPRSDDRLVEQARESNLDERSEKTLPRVSAGTSPESIVCRSSKKRYSILNEIKKSKILGTSDSFPKLNSDSSSNGAKSRHAKSFLNTLKKYL